MKPNSDSSQPNLSRRDFLGQGAIYSGAFLAMLNLPRPNALAAAHASSEPVSFSSAQWKSVETITGRIIPTDEEPGAIEANCVNFIDKVLANEDKAQKSIYEKGLTELNTVSRKRFDKAFIDLNEVQQDEILAKLETDEVEGWSDSAGSPATFFATVRAHTLIGFLSDPKYGGNQDYVGWKLIGYPGPRHHAGGFTPDQMQGKALIKAVWE
ncbi:MAG: gluconate 2-dehydrogenase subunit 3 family protein [Opitutales bacterium]|nr:gluconate 2-dehydrogenase subunit 3 family protein [Opitutales bacterium]